MKKIGLFFTMVLGTMVTVAQVTVPQPSPSAKIDQTIGLTEVTVEYSRPSKKGRTIYGNLVPYDKVWRTGANKNTQITFGDDVKVGGKELKKGSYAIFTKPGKDSWEIMFYTDTNNWGTPQKWEESKVAAKISAKPNQLPMEVETFTIMFNDFTMDSAMMYLVWSNIEVPVKIEVPSKEKAMKSIEVVMAGPSDGDHYQAAVFYKEVGEYDKAKEHIEKAIALRKNPAFWYHRQQSLIYAAKGNKDEAIKAAKTSLALAEKAGNADYVKMNKDSLAEWGAK
ncbi:DUF2911 domain-containing protein [Aquimarina brevivitae]|uniref:Tetratricopeptide repeat protein n=1 Tax=Aquimarina brevivitae TaxID=323412 RepID=A0A4Q7NW98_9FLAO|nr:DUF2911 domain-containing protein [Aquimarina brevivitae]RZS90672.1 tetratricopeptide repeat protein [Aquimarina brevivitae]